MAASLRILIVAVSVVACTNAYGYDNVEFEPAHFPDWPEKSSWPEVEGLTLEEATNIIRQDNPDLYIKILPEGSPITYDLRSNRVRVFVDQNERVVGVPVVG